METERAPVIAIDAMGGDFAPEIPAKAVKIALDNLPVLKIILVGQEEKIKPLVPVDSRIELVHAGDIITNNESPVMALRKKPDASLSVALRLLREGKADALVSAGSTGAVMAGSMFRLERIQGIERPALAVLVPTVDKPCLMLDIGANVDVTPETLVSFALMGHVYSKHVMGVESPRIALVNIGEEAEKGNSLTKEAYKRLSEPGQPFNFIGNVEARGVPLGEADVAVCDGFTGNILMKTMEGLSKALFAMIKSGLSASVKGRIAGLLAMETFKKLKKELSPDEIGGALMLGVSQPVVKAHGNSNENAYYNAIRQAYQIIRASVVTRIAEALLQA